MHSHDEHSTPTNELHIGLIGCGPKTGNVLERLTTLAGLPPNDARPIKILIFDPGVPGAGIHTLDLPDYIVLNTPAGLVTQFPGDIFADPAHARFGESFLEFLRANGLPGAQPEDYAPRRYAGEYFHACFRRLVEDLSPNVTVSLVPALVTGIVPLAGGYELRTDAGTQHWVERMFVAPGHTDSGRRKSADTDLVQEPYPTKKWRMLPPGSTLALAGKGLVAFDVLAELTHGQGGTFERCGGQLVYQASGTEPRILLFNRNGVPSAARATLAKGLDCGPFRLTPERIRALRKSHGARLSLKTDLEPLISEEAAAAWYIAHVRNARGEAIAAAESARVRTLESDATFEGWRAEMAQHYAPFDVASFLWPSPGGDLESAQAYEAWVRAWLERDIAETKRGLARSPWKFAAEAVKQARSGVREAVNFNGLDDASALEFYRRIAPMINRLAIGPDLQRVEELLALMDSGVVNFSSGPNPELVVGLDGKATLRARAWPAPAVPIARYCAAQMPPPALRSGSSTSVQAMLQSRFGLALANVTIDSNFGLKDATTGESYGIWLHGQICEGISYYNNYVSCNSSDGQEPSVAFFEAHAAAAALLAMATKHG